MSRFVIILWASVLIASQGMAADLKNPDHDTVIRLINYSITIINEGFKVFKERVKHRSQESNRIQLEVTKEFTQNISVKVNNTFLTIRRSMNTTKEESIEEDKCRKWRSDYHEAGIKLLGNLSSCIKSAMDKVANPVERIHGIAYEKIKALRQFKATVRFCHESESDCVDDSEVVKSIFYWFIIHTLEDFDDFMQATGRSSIVNAVYKSPLYGDFIEKENIVFKHTECALVIS
ncbi:uncharacterized protein [Venturia canescens]|uniref:uncharacterized protein n=1 Tax=Venturia canescens TaxID=32260 RepID=UPI001C9CD6E5|nr:uncharacterized protein LOC122410866 [Venturia canescens]